MNRQPNLRNIARYEDNLDRGRSPGYRTARSSRTRQVHFTSEVGGGASLIDDKTPQLSDNEQESRVEMKHTSVQADPVPSSVAGTTRGKKKKKRGTKADLSKRSIGVGSLCIDDTMLEASRILLHKQNIQHVSVNSGSTMTKKINTSSKKLKEISQKKYLSSDGEAKTE